MVSGTNGAFVGFLDWFNAHTSLFLIFEGDWEWEVRFDGVKVGFAEVYVLVPEFLVSGFSEADGV